MGRSEGAGQQRGGKRKSNARMNYLKQNKYSRGGGGRGGGRGGSWSGDGYHQRKQRLELTSGMKGFFCTTNFRPSDCVKEAYNLLNEYYRPEDDGNKNETANDVPSSEESPAAKGAEGTEAEKPEVKKTAPSDDEEDIDEAMKKELKELKSDVSVKRFQSVETNCKNIMFINTTVENPVELACRIFDDVLTKGEAKSRYICRFLPIEGTCRADIPVIKEFAKTIFQKYFSAGYKSFKVLANVKYTGLSKDDLIAALAQVVSEVNPLNIVNLKEPEYYITAEVIRTTLCLSVLKDFNKYKKFNLTEAGNPTPVAPDASNQQGGNPKAAATEPSVENVAATESEEPEKFVKSNSQEEGDQVEEKNKKDPTD